MDPLTLGSLIGAAGNVAGGAMNSLSTGFQNRASRKWADEMYRRQFSDNVNFWRMQNEYNSPQAQMQRLQAAGLNPNLVYGGSPAQAAGSAGPIKSPEVQTPQFRSSEMGNAISAIGSHFDYELKQAQTDNLKTQNNVLIAEAALKGATTAKTNFDLDFAKEMRQVSADAMREALRQTKTNTEFTLSQNERAEAMNASNLQEAAVRIAKMRAETANTRVERNRILASIDNLREDTNLKRLDRELWAAGVSRNDPPWWRALMRALQDIEKEIPNVDFSPGGLFKSIFK